MTTTHPSATREIKRAFSVCDRIGAGRESGVGHLPRHGVLTIGTDGSARTEQGESAGPGGWAFYADDTTYGFGSLPNTTSGVAEMHAVIAALRAVPAHLGIELITDCSDISMLLSPVDGVPRIGAEAGLRNIARARRPERAEQLRALRGLLMLRTGPLTVRQVKAHSGLDPLNVAADQLARRASSRQRLALRNAA